MKAIRRTLLWRIAAYIAHVSTRGWRPFPASQHRTIARMFRKLPCECNIVQIGSNDGRTGDPLYPFIANSRHNLVLVEPVPKNFERLMSTYARRPNTHLFRAAIACGNHSLPFYCVNDPDGKYPEYFNQLGSFSRETIMKQAVAWPTLGQDVISIPVECVKLEKVLKDADFRKVDVLHTDVEGCDLDILESVDLEALGVSVLMFEHAHLDSARYRKFLCELSRLSYSVRDLGTDTIAYRFKGRDQ